MKRTLKTLTLALSASVVAATGVLADPTCQTRRLAGDWTLSVNGYLPDTTQTPVFVDHIYIACDVSISSRGQMTGNCQDMLAASVGEPAVSAIVAQFSLASRTCFARGSGTLGGTSATFEGRVLATTGTRVDVVEGSFVVPLPVEPLPGVNFVVMDARMIRQPWAGSTFDLSTPATGD